MKVRIFVGTGGVGKTSVAAASGLKYALDGGKCLVLTIDPALRLKTALGLDGAILQQRVELGASGELWAGLMDVRSTLDRAVKLYGNPEQAETVLNHPIYQMLITSLAGMQELLAIERIDQAISDGFEMLFIDTAPSRHAFEFLDKPEFFAQLVSFPMVRLVGRTYKWWEGSALSRIGRKSVELYSRVEEILGAKLVRQVLDFYSVFRTIAEGYADRAKRTSRLLHDRGVTSFTIVTTPFKCRRDAEFLVGELQKRNFYVDTLLVNRVWPELRIELPPGTPPLAAELGEWYREISGAQGGLWQAVSQEYSASIPCLKALPELRRDVDGMEALKQVAAVL
jgi:anion-transporting  ArsA/GET3 family ATPase